MYTEGIQQRQKSENDQEVLDAELQEALDVWVGTDTKLEREAAFNCFEKKERTT